MAYNPATDFLGLLRQTSGGVRSEDMPGLDYIVLALNRMGFLTLSVGQTAPVTNQASTVWLQPAVPSWSAEGVVRLWNPLTNSYQPATPALWANLFTPTGYLFQSLTNASNIVSNLTTLAGVQRAAPAATAIILPSLINRLNKPLQIVDASTGVVNHAITLSTPDGALFPGGVATWQLNSTPDQLATTTLQPSPELNEWVFV